MKKTRLLLTLFSVLTLGVGLSACPGPKGDDDDGPANTNCQVVWANDGSTALRYDIYLVDMPIAEWTDGTKEYDYEDTDRVAIFYDEMLVASNLYLARAITTAGTFSVTATQGTAIGEPVTLADDGNQVYFDLGANDKAGVYVGSGGVANFASNWSKPCPCPPGALDPDPTARVAISYLNTSYSLGGFTNYAICYRRDGAFAEESPARRATRALREFFPRP